MIKDILSTQLHTAGITASETQIDQLSHFFEMIVERNKVMNLTTITEPEEAARLHFVDSLMLLRYLPLEEDGISLVDIGTGAGFPGIPLKILRPQLHVTLVDSLAKRLSFLEEVIEELGLRAEGSIETAHGRAEDLAGRKGALRERFDIATARAVAALPVLAEYCLPFVKTGGTFVAYKTETAEAEVTDAKRALQELGGWSRAVEHYSLPDSDTSRSLIFIDKTDKTPAKYPRQAGTPSKKPL